MSDVERRAPIALTTLYAVAMFGVAALVVFAIVANGVEHSGALTRFDLRDFSRRQSTVTAEGARFYVIVSLVGSPASMTILAALGALRFGWQRHMLLLVSWIIAFAGAGLLVVILKRTIHRSRPDGAGLFLHGTSLSFPSGHAVGSMVGFGMLTYVLLRCRVTGHASRAGVVATASLIVGLIAYSRLYLGVHYISDVIAGLALGTVWLIICVGAAEFARRHGPPLARGRRAARNRRR